MLTELKGVHVECLGGRSLRGEKSQREGLSVEGCSVGEEMLFPLEEVGGAVCLLCESRLLTAREGLEADAIGEQWRRLGVGVRQRGAVPGRRAARSARSGLEKMETERLPVASSGRSWACRAGTCTHGVLLLFCVKGNGYGRPGIWRQRLWGLDLHDPRERSKES